MIAKAGAGPEPIPYSSLTSINLTEAIGFALNPGVKVAVQQLSRQMRSESGVEAAVTHFHSKLPLERLMCDVIPELPASWTYKGKHSQVLMSKRAERLLTRSHKLDQKKLKL
jgi:hypothetical protein